MKSFDSLTIIASLIIGSILITSLHEIGHAVTASLLTKKRTDIYMGSYGKDGKYIRFNIWHINFNISYKFWKHYGGLCITKADTITINQQIAYTLAGPIFPVVIISAFVWSTQILDINEYVIANSYVVLILSVISMIYNFIPQENTEIIYNGLTIHNDGYQIINLLKIKRFNKGLKAIDNLQYKKAEKIFSQLRHHNVLNTESNRCYIFSILKLKRYEQAKILFDDFFKIHIADGNDYCNAGFVHSMLGMKTEALAFYEKAMKLDNSNMYTLNNYGYALNLAGKYDKSIPFFDRSIAVNPEFAYSYNNRGLAKIKLGFTNEGLEDLEHGHTLDPNNSYYFKNMGTYYSDSKVYSKALAFFEKAKEMDKDTHEIDEDILRTKTMLDNYEL